MAKSEMALLLAELEAAADPVRAKSSEWFFKTGKGQYGEGDQFMGIKVPQQRKIALRHRQISEAAIKKLLASRIHEHRFVALEILVARFEAGTPAEQTDIYRFYLANTAGINNWDLVDTSAPYIVGAYLLTRPRAVLRKLTKSSSLWERRIAIVATFAFIRARQTADTFAIAKLLLGDEHELIHKAVGWALREAGKHSREELVRFLEDNYQKLPRTTLRYAIERFTPADRELFLSGNFTPTVTFRQVRSG
jgi:3-methyladenine DNA glycosylase AlkD